jgi:hypothetical protein
MTPVFSIRHPWDVHFWQAFAVTAWIVVACGFAGQIQLRFTGDAASPAPPALQLHVWSAFGWLALLTLQIALAGSGRLGWHRRLGLAAIALAPLVAGTAIAAEIHSQRFNAAQFPDNIRFFPIPVASSAAFLCCVGAALLLRRRGSAHKRLIYCATSAVLVAAFYRWWGEAIYDALPQSHATEWAANYLGVAVMLAAGMIYDLATRGSLHPVFRIAAPLMIAGQVAAIWLGQAEWWPAAGRRLLDIP